MSSTSENLQFNWTIYNIAVEIVIIVFVFLFLSLSFQILYLQRECLS